MNKDDKKEFQNCVIKKESSSGFVYLVLFGFIFALILLFIGEPDLHDKLLGLF